MITTLSSYEEAVEIPKPERRRLLPPRDYVILPLLSLATILFLGGVAEAGARIFWPSQELDTCSTRVGIDHRFRPNCTSRLKTAEGPWTTNHYNECGYRTNDPCGPKPPGTLRLVMLGSSLTHGVFVPYEQTFPTRVGVAVAQDLKRPVQIENLGVFGATPLDCYRRLPEALAMKADAVVFTVSPFDLLFNLDPERLKHRNDQSVPNRPSANKKRSLLEDLHRQAVDECMSAVVAQHYVFQNTDTSVRVFLASGERSDFVRQPLSPAWSGRFADLHTLVNEMAARLRARNIPLLLVAVPNRADAALLNPKYSQPHVDAYAFGNVIRSVAEEAGATYVDVMHPLSKLARPEDLYYVVSNHPTGEGHAVIAEAVIPAVERALASKVNSAKETN